MQQLAIGRASLWYDGFKDGHDVDDRGAAAGSRGGRGRVRPDRGDLPRGHDPSRLRHLRRAGPGPRRGAGGLADRLAEAANGREPERSGRGSWRWPRTRLATTVRRGASGLGWSRSSSMMPDSGAPDPADDDRAGGPGERPAPPQGRTSARSSRCATGPSCDSNEIGPLLGISASGVRARLLGSWAACERSSTMAELDVFEDRFTAAYRRYLDEVADGGGAARSRGSSPPRTRPATGGRLARRSGRHPRSPGWCCLPCCWPPGRGRLLRWLATVAEAPGCDTARQQTAPRGTHTT